MDHADYEASLDAYKRVSAHMLGGIATFALQLALEGRLTIDDVENLTHRLAPPVGEDDGPAYRALRDQWDGWIYEYLGDAHAAAKVRSRG